MSDKYKQDNYDAEWNMRKEKTPIIQWIVLVILLAILAYLASGI